MPHGLGLDHVRVERVSQIGGDLREVLAAGEIADTLMVFRCKPPSVPPRHGVLRRIAARDRLQQPVEGDRAFALQRRRGGFDAFGGADRIRTKRS
jgi:hypothetical protein